MFRISAILISIVFVFSSSALAQSKYKGIMPSQLTETFVTAYTSKSLPKLDKIQPFNKPFKVIIEHTSADPGSPDETETRTFKSFLDFEKWLEERESDGMPKRVANKPGGCRKRICTFANEGETLHRHLYVDSLEYGLYRGAYYYKTIRLLDGD